MTLYELKKTFLFMSEDEQLELIKIFRQKRYDLAIKPKSRSVVVKKVEKTKEQMLEEFNKLPKSIQEHLIKQLEERVKNHV